MAKVIYAWNAGMSRVPREEAPFSPAGAVAGGRGTWDGLTLTACRHHAASHPAGAGAAASC